MKTKLKIIHSLMAMGISLGLSSCGGDGTLVADGGINGTGITSIGRITEFGSIYVNGIKFEVDNASFTRDGVVSQGQSEFSLGEYIVIKGTLSSDQLSGIASEVLFSDILEGEVTNISIDGSSIDVLGQTITVDNQTKFHDFNSLSDLFLGNIVEVSGIKTSGTTSIATSIKRKELSFDDDSENELKGTVSNLDTVNKTFNINTIIIDYTGAELDGFGAEGLQNGLFVEVKSKSKLTNNILVATEVELEEDEHHETDEDTELELEGLVTRYISATDFDVNGLTVTTTVDTEFEGGTTSDITLDVLVEVKGLVNAFGILVAKEVKFEESEDEEDDD